MLPDGLNRLRNLAGSSKNYHGISISCIFLQSPHQVELKNIVKSWKDFLWYSVTLETYRAFGRLTVKKINLIQIWYLEFRIQYLEFRTFLPIKYSIEIIF